MVSWENKQLYYCLDTIIQAQRHITTKKIKDYTGRLGNSVYTYQDPPDKARSGGGTPRPSACQTEHVRCFRYGISRFARFFLPTLEKRAYPSRNPGDAPVCLYACACAW